MPSPLPPIDIQLMRLPNGEGLPVPAYATAHAAGMDVVSAEEIILNPGDRHPVATGFALAIPEGYEIQVRPRSGLALKTGFIIPNSPGTVDEDFRGCVMVGLYYLGRDPYTIRHGDRIAQAVIAEVRRYPTVVVEELSGTERGSGGFGSTGRN